VTSVEVQPEPLFGFQPPFPSLPTDPLVGVPVSLGQAKFDTADGGSSDAFEAVVGCRSPSATSPGRSPPAPRTSPG
jgi:hypothetical protein